MKIILVFLSLGAFVLIAACAPDSAKKDINPNGSSELAILMRDMFDDGMKVKEQILEGRDADVKVDYLKIHTAKATEPEKVSTPEYASFAAAYVASVQAFNEAMVHNKKETYSQMVISCIGCHSKVCQGPIRKIRKMELPG